MVKDIKESSKGKKNKVRATVNNSTTAFNKSVDVEIESDEDTVKELLEKATDFIDDQREKVDKSNKDKN